MPRRNRGYSRRQTASTHLRRNILIVAGIAVIAVVGIAIAFRPTSAPSGANFPAKEMGPQTAKIVVQEFADFQCPYCAYFHSTGETRLRQQYINTGIIRFIFRNYPIVGTESDLSAMASLCAGDQSMFWEYHDLLFKNQGAENSGTFSTPRLEAFAAQLNLDSVKFDQCLSNQTFESALNADIQLGKYYGIHGTPSFFVNGRFVDTGTDFQALFDAIDKALAA